MHTTLTGSPASSVVAVPVLTAFLTFALLAWARGPDGRPGRTAASATLDSLTGLAIDDVARKRLRASSQRPSEGAPAAYAMARGSAAGGKLMVMSEGA